jgi:ferritin-like metal-binding protein YciE
MAMLVHTLDHLLLYELRELYDAEHELVKMLATMVHEVHDARTAQVLNTLRCETRSHVFGLEQALSTLGHVPRRGKCRWFQGLVEGYAAFLRTGPLPSAQATFDQAVILKAVRAAIAGYRIVITLALRLNHPQIVDPLRLQLWEQEAAAERLQQLLGRPEPDAAQPEERFGQSAMSAFPPPVDGLPPEPPEDRENVLAAGQDAY